jgi:hypothetical protein
MRLNHSQIFRSQNARETLIWVLGNPRCTKVEREEFLVIIVFAKAKFIKMLYTWCGKDGTVFGDLDLEQLELNLESFQKIAHGTKQADPLRNLIFISSFVG